MGYCLLDSGEGKKLERFGSKVIVRPCPAAIWPKSKPSLWKGQVFAEFIRSGEQGIWNISQRGDPEWDFRVGGLNFELKCTPFGHLGFFPEHMGFWSLFSEAVVGKGDCRVLNLFAYTGAASLFFARHGASVRHVDASKAAVRWAERNYAKNCFAEKKIFWVIEDVFSFLKKEIRRGSVYDVIILDPPTYGRGTNKEIFRIDEHFFPLLRICNRLLSSRANLLLASSHTPGHTPALIERLVRSSVCREGHFFSGESFIGEGFDRVPSGCFAAWKRF
ncbi:class I SAM-dependent methyltransferase [Chlamydiifrater phoenicopteri]|uniref:class I SAM-dependent methyltransferase n=1 Tax=Chlamydiifrater phoenicopteri TaxID=2681469 RepID=UPI001BD09C38|nr:class I SAM-dependent methyltransferase [Chlamydiifrater phoenicopteri]